MKICIPEFFTARLLARRSGVRFPESAGDFLFFAMSILSLGPSIHWVPEPYSPGVRRPEREVNHILRPMLGLTLIRSIFISVFNQLDAQNLFYNKFNFMSLHVSSTCAHHQEVKIALHSLWYHHTYRWPSRARVERRLETATYMCDDTRGCVMQF